MSESIVKMAEEATEKWYAQQLECHIAKAKETNTDYDRMTLQAFRNYKAVYFTSYFMGYRDALELAAKQQD